MGRVVFRNIKKKYPGEKRFSVDDFNLEVADGEFLVLVGPSGCGKSTLLRMLAGLEDISEGEIFIDESMINYVSSKDRNIAMVFQNYALYPHMTVYENIAFGLRLRKLAKHDIHERVSKAAKILEIEANLQKQPKQLSGGQRQRVALGRAIVREPDVFLMDEPLSNLDAKLRVQMREEITKLHRRLQTTTVYVTHDQIEAMTMGTRIVVMKGGIIQQVGAPKDIYNNPANMFVAGFIGTPPMNFITGKIRSEGDDLFFETKRYSLLVPEQKRKALINHQAFRKNIVIGVRAEKAICQHAGTGAESGDLSHNRFSSKVEMMEFMGSDTFLHVYNQDHRMTVRVNPMEFPTEEGDEVTVVLDMNSVLFFDSNTEDLIC